MSVLSYIKKMMQVNGGKVYSEKEAEQKLNKIPNALTLKTIEEAHKGKGIGQPIRDITTYIDSL